MKGYPMPIPLPGLPTPQGLGSRDQDGDGKRLRRVVRKEFIKNLGYGERFWSHLLMSA